LGAHGDARKARVAGDQVARDEVVFREGNEDAAGQVGQRQGAADVGADDIALDGVVARVLEAADVRLVDLDPFAAVAGDEVPGGRGGPAHGVGLGAAVD